MYTGAQIIISGSFIEHFFYSFVCIFPAFFYKYDNPPITIHKGLILNKVIQSLSLFYMNEMNIEFNSIFLTGSILIGVGQLLNISVYKAIGFNGVYYGILFGEKYKVPWVTSFPYNMPIKHPQYIGAYLCYLGVWLCAYNTYDIEFIKFAIMMALSYIMISIVEIFRASPKYEV
jgi:hypothetical protein